MDNMEKGTDLCGSLGGPGTSHCPIEKTQLHLSGLLKQSVDLKVIGLQIKTNLRTKAFQTVKTWVLSILQTYIQNLMIYEVRGSKLVIIGGIVGAKCASSVGNISCAHCQGKMFPVVWR